MNSGVASISQKKVESPPSTVTLQLWNVCAFVRLCCLVNVASPPIVPNDTYIMKFDNLTKTKEECQHSGVKHVVWSQLAGPTFVSFVLFHCSVVCRSHSQVRCQCCCCCFGRLSRPQAAAYIQNPRPALKTKSASGLVACNLSRQGTGVVWPSLPLTANLRINKWTYYYYSCDC